MTTYVTFCHVTVEPWAVDVSAAAMETETLTESGTSQQTSAAAPCNYARVLSSADIVVRSGSDPTVTTANGLVIKANVPEVVYVGTGNKLAIKTV
ncbi:MAG: hypothetical protein KDI55_00335 [Anaerolineae bacterium]|nr:hypothetical protein [Anaerolineae bacterium]